MISYKAYLNGQPFIASIGKVGFKFGDTGNLHVQEIDASLYGTVSISVDNSTKKNNLYILESKSDGYSDERP